MPDCDCPRMEGTPYRVHRWGCENDYANAYIMELARRVAERLNLSSHTLDFDQWEREMDHV